MDNEYEYMLSVIVPCYNCKRWIKRLLNSILIQNFSDVEILLIDDNSTDDFMSEVEPYKSILNIKYYKTNPHKVHCPGNTRRDGLGFAKGKWVTFIDQDDEFIPDAFNTVFSQLELHKDLDLPFVYSPILRIVGEQLDILEATTWLHGNFYKRKFLVDNNINFKEDLFGNEDLYFNNLVNGTIHGQGLSFFKLDKPVYKWISNPDSTSNNTGDVEYTEKYFADYLVSNTEPHIICLDKYPWKADKFQAELIQCLRFCYLYYQRTLYKYKNPEVAEKMFSEIKDVYHKVLTRLNFTTDIIIDLMYQQVDEYIESTKTIYNLSGKFVPKQSMMEFFKKLD